MNERLGSRHRDTLEKLFRHAGGNVDWRQVRSLLEAVGSVSEEHDGTLRVTIGDQKQVFRPPHNKDVDRQMMVDLRRLLTRAGYSPGR
jgi:hypothetical protein